MTVTISITDEDIYTALRAFLLLILPAGIEVVQAQVNRVPPPAAADYVVMNSVGRTRLETNVTSWDYTDPDPLVFDSKVPADVAIQIDVHGPNSADNAWLIVGMLRGGFACDNFPASIQPLHADDPKQIPFMDGEQQVEDRWVIDSHLQANPVISVSQDFANTATVGLINVDAAYPPGG